MAARPVPETKWTYHTDSSGSAGQDCAWVDCVVWIPAGGPPTDQLAEAVDSDLSYSTDGNDTWFSTSARYYYGDRSAQSGGISHNEQTWMQTSVEGEGTLIFYWRVSSEADDDYLEFYIDDALQTGRISGSTAWAQKSYEISGTGTHTFKWRYVKDDEDDDYTGYDCGWVDYVQWTPEVPPPLPTTYSTLSYAYDPAGRRIAKAYDGTVVMKYLYDGEHIIAEYDGNGTLLHKYIYGPGVDQPICMIDVSAANATYYYHFDGLGSVVALSDASGDTVQVYEYSIFGEVAASDPNHPNRFLFTGREFDAETGLYYYRARYYNPYIGRFLQTDPAGQGMNQYAYCGNNSVCWTDSTGCEPVFHMDKPDDYGRYGWWARGEGFPEILENPGGVPPGPYFNQHLPASCLAVCILNVCVTLGVVPNDVIPKGKGPDRPFGRCATDAQAEQWVVDQLNQAPGGGSAFGTGFYASQALAVLGSDWSKEDNTDNNATINSIVAAVEQRRPVIFAINVESRDACGQAIRVWHCVSLVPTPETLRKYIKRKQGLNEAFSFLYPYMAGPEPYASPTAATMTKEGAIELLGRYGTLSAVWLKGPPAAMTTE